MYVSLSLSVPSAMCVVMKPNAKNTFIFRSLFLFDIHKNNTSTRMCVFFNICYHSAFKDPKGNGACVDLMLQVRVSAIFLSLIV
jgi:hypothetical protein